MKAGEAPYNSISPRPFRWDDLEEFTHLVNSVQEITNLPGVLSTSYMEELLRQPGCVPEENCLVVEVGGVLSGYVLLVPEIEIERVVLEGGVAQPHRRNGIGGRLLDAALRRARSLRAGVVHIAVPDSSPESHAFLEHRGFSLVRRYWEMRWQEENVPPLDLPEGFSVRSYVPGDEEMLARLQNTAFGDSWGFCPNTPEEIAYKANLSRYRLGGIQLIQQGNETAAYCWSRIDGDGAERIGVLCMAGVLPQYRGLALGRTSLLSSMAHLHSQGVDSITLTVDEENTQARDTWVSMGFRKVGVTLWYEQKLKP